MTCNFPICSAALTLAALCASVLLPDHAHAHAHELEAKTFRFKDGGSATYYTFSVGPAADSNTVVFFYGGSGCRSWSSVMPGYVEGLAAGAQVHVLNKRFVADQDKSPKDCSRRFHLANNPRQWFSDDMEFISAKLHDSPKPPTRVLLVGVSEGGLTAAKVARSRDDITHLAVIGHGGWTMRKSLTTLSERGSLPFKIEDGWKEVASDVQSIDRTWLGNKYRWWFDIMDLDPLPDYLALRQPLLIGFGENDQSVPVESAQFLKSALNAAGKSNVSLMVYPGADHSLKANGKSYRIEFFQAVSKMLE